MKKLFGILCLVFLFSNTGHAGNLKVIDGDTIVLNGEKIRFSGIDSPELKQTCIKDDQKVFCGRLAKKFLIKKINNNTPQCISEGRDVYKRTLAECFVDGESLSSFLVRSGYAFAYRKYSKKFIQDEEFAKDNKFGLWSMEFQYPWEFRKALKTKLIKPNNNIEPRQVVKIQLSGLMNNDKPNIDNGIKQTWEFAHPSNKKYTGPLSSFINLLKSENYKMLLNHLESEIIKVFESNNRYGFEVRVLGGDKNYYKFQWIVEKYYEEGPLKDCWLTTSVSNPVSLGSSI